MPFMKGKAPVRRTLQYLEAGKLVLKDQIKIFSINYNTHGTHHEGARQFVFWNLPQLQYKNPSVQVITFKNLTPSPFIRAYYESGEQMLIDIDSKSRDEVLAHLLRVIGKSEDVLAKEAQQKEKKDNPANFGIGCDRFCMCEIPGQVPCPAVIPLPMHMRGKHKNPAN
ncbi:probable 28S ribosomal protein S25, mitochondrial [Chrysoperla carnea]|uniref:probable 28S ribosomal protein S25, mitochondrial n=1 Tax=Chrysoperla carnea TaxID=189513 RepID=UPI001D0797BE|nr:probable 28S ribosomal protein S25, mitochondrial [Chrysoperla carnea]